MDTRGTQHRKTDFTRDYLPHHDSKGRGESAEEAIYIHESRDYAIRGRGIIHHVVLTRPTIFVAKSVRCKSITLKYMHLSLPYNTSVLFPHDSAHDRRCTRQGGGIISDQRILLALNYSCINKWMHYVISPSFCTGDVVQRCVTSLRVQSVYGTE